MFKKAYLAKFEFENLPDGLTSLDVAAILLSSNDFNFAVTRENDGAPDYEGEYWAAFSTLQSSKKYGAPTRIMQNFAMGGTRTTSDFILFRDPSHDKELNLTHPMTYIKAYTEIIKACNKAIKQHIAATELIAAMYANSQEEYNELKKFAEHYDGIRILKRNKKFNDFESGLQYVQFDITPRGGDLETLKRDLETDLCTHIGIYNGTDKTHITNNNLMDSEQLIDLGNSYELKLWENFCDRYNKWMHRSEDDKLKVKIHTVSRDNSIQKTENKETIDNDDSGN